MKSLDRVALLEMFPWPHELEGRVLETDGAGDFDALWALVAARQPRWMVELGTRHGTSTRVMRSASNRHLLTIDPVDATKYLEGCDCTIWTMTGEEAFGKYLWEADLMFIDTDPHSYEQTKGWLETWVDKKLRRGGIAAFHDTISCKDGVNRALEEWVGSHPNWVLTEMGAGHGLGVLQCPVESK